MSREPRFDDTESPHIDDDRGVDGHDGLAKARERCKRLTVKESLVTAQLLVLLDCLPVDCSSSDLVPLAVANFLHACVCHPHSPVVNCLRTHGLALRVTADQQVVVCNASDGALIPSSHAAADVASRIWCDALGGDVPAAAHARMDVEGTVRAMMTACLNCVTEEFEWLPRGFRAVVVMKPVDDEDRFEGETAGELMVESETQPAIGEFYDETHHSAAAGNDCEPRRKLVPTMIWPDASRYRSEHIKLLAPRCRPSFSSPGHIVARAVLDALADVPHEFVHCLQSSSCAYQEISCVIGNEVDFYREHDASAPALNLMRDALAAAAADGDVENKRVDALLLPGLVETVVVTQMLELQSVYSTTLTPDHELLYQAWAQSCGKQPLTLDADVSGPEVDAHKQRLALESFPRPLKPQLNAIIGDRMLKDGGCCDPVADFPPLERAAIGSFRDLRQVIGERGDAALLLQRLLESGAAVLREC
jgi:hypothetical protein